MNKPVDAWLVQSAHEPPGHPRWCARELSGTRTVAYRCLATGVQLSPSFARVLRKGRVSIEVTEIKPEAKS